VKIGDDLGRDTRIRGGITDDLDRRDQAAAVAVPDDDGIRAGAGGILRERGLHKPVAGKLVDVERPLVKNVVRSVRLGAIAAPSVVTDTTVSQHMLIVGMSIMYWRPSPVLPGT